MNHDLSTLTLGLLSSNTYGQGLLHSHRVEVWSHTYVDDTSISGELSIKFKMAEFGVGFLIHWRI